MSESKDAVALLAFRNAKIDYFGPKLIGHDFCRSSFNQDVVAILSRSPVGGERKAATRRFADAQNDPI